ncbi:MAG: hypothetical protein FWC75_07605 [Oscillospiraceae bacterium]|nr:hypothetical protein [Oscillospiraceae bacterium]
MELIGQRNMENLSHAYIVSPTLVSALAQAALCSATDDVKPCTHCIHCDKASRGIHPDINWVSRAKDKKEIAIEQIRSLRKSVIVIPNDAAKSVYIIEDADTMNKNAQNALLQMIEEPPPHAMFILSTTKTAALLPTVRSRCVELSALPQQLISTDSQAQALANEFFTTLSADHYEFTTFMFKLEKLDKESMTQFIDAAKESTTIRLKSAISRNSSINHRTLALAERVLTKAADMLELNVGTGHISGMICASLLED